MTTVAPGETPTVVDKLEKGERISVHTAAGWQEDLRIVDVNAANIRTERRREVIVFARTDILEIQVPRAAPGKTAALAAGIYFGALIGLCGDLTKRNGC
jgi:hypothetical protein